MIRLLLADHHQLFREAVRQILTAAEGIEIVGEVGSAPEVLARVRELAPGVLLLGFLMPEAGGLETMIERLRKHHPALRILVLTARPEDQLAVRCLRAGAAGYVTKDHAAADLLAAVRHVARGHKYVSGKLAERLAADLAHGAPGLAPHAALSGRELEILRGLATTRTVSQIARDLRLSVKTVSTYRTRVLQKLGFRSTPELMRYAIEQRLVEIPRREASRPSAHAAEKDDRSAS
jgi:two-component system invasion response regulator UvrY